MKGQKCSDLKKITESSEEINFSDSFLEEEETESDPSSDFDEPNKICLKLDGNDPELESFVNVESVDQICNLATVIIFVKWLYDRFWIDVEKKIISKIIQDL
ncbi:MAG: hypothetical protein Ta2E_09360 [Mycoplasmoidaceae bacterium]|nr:MAG: hypothetical protein Ta2E_09360 [Mycoplasmoidaceae bacterium]